MASFYKAIDIVLRNEGSKYTNDPRDPGGETKYGITAIDLKEAIKKEIIPKDTTVKDLTKDQAILIYKTLYWDKIPNLQNINSDVIATKLFDTLVNIGTYHAIKFVQHAINQLSGQAINEDGIFGPITLKSINNVNTYILLPLMRKNQANYYRNIIKSDPSKNCFLKGWLNRSER